MRECACWHLVGLDVLDVRRFLLFFFAIAIRSRCTLRRSPHITCAGTGSSSSRERSWRLRAPLVAAAVRCRHAHGDPY